MSTSTPAAAGNAMRQQLDELDALLQRMLTLPINQLDEPAPAGRGPDRPKEDLPAPVAHTPSPPQGHGGWRPPSMILLTDPEPAAEPQATTQAWDPSWSINLNPLHGSSVLGPRSPAAAASRPIREAAAPPQPTWRAEPVTPAAAPVPRPQPQPLPAPQVDHHMAPAVAAGPAPAPQPTFSARSLLRPAPEPPPPALLLPLVAVNRLFDGLVTPFGALGIWLRGPAGRDLLGYAGLLLLAGSAAWGVLDWIGWTR